MRGRSLARTCSFGWHFGLTYAVEPSVHPGVSARSSRVFAGVRAAGKAGAVMAGLAVRESVTLTGRAERARAARVLVGEILGAGHPCADMAVLLVSEIFSNSVRYSGSAAAGEAVTVAVIARDGAVRVEVSDRSGPGTPQLRPADGEADGGRGLQLVAALAAQWGWQRYEGQTVTWFVLQDG